MGSVKSRPMISGKLSLGTWKGRENVSRWGLVLKGGFAAVVRKNKKHDNSGGNTIKVERQGRGKVQPRCDAIVKSVTGERIRGGKAFKNFLLRRLNNNLIYIRKFGRGGRIGKRSPPSRQEEQIVTTRPGGGSLGTGVDCFVDV